MKGPLSRSTINSDVQLLYANQISKATISLSNPNDLIKICGHKAMQVIGEHMNLIF